MRIDLEPKCGTTAMGIMPHRDPVRALQLACSLDVPFWPQLPRLTFSEDMFAQFAHRFPGAAVDLEGKRVDFNLGRFHADLEMYLAGQGNFIAFDIDDTVSLTFDSFLARLSDRNGAIRGHWCGPVNFGFRVTDDEKRPIIYNDEVRMVLFDYALNCVNTQYRRLRSLHPNAFVWVDEPGLGWVFNSFSGYNELQAQSDYRDFLQGFEGPRALHLCLNVHLPYLLDLGLDILSIDAFQFEHMPKGYAEPIAAFIRNGGIISWGLVPTESVTLDPETPESLFGRLVRYWDVIEGNSDVTAEAIARQALIAPSKCCIKNAVLVDITDTESTNGGPGVCSVAEMEEELVERAFSYLPEISEMLREKYHL